jgi:ribosomal protein S18 acetylase RimI-like enzyme
MIDWDIASPKNSMGISIRRCHQDDLPSLLGLLDNQFLKSKGVLLSLAQRFPRVFLSDNLRNIYIARDGDALCGAVVSRRFLWITSQGCYRGAMVGMVCTDTEYRGRGIASYLLQALRTDWLAAKVDFGVLWTTISPFYERLGWRLQDHGVFGEALSVEHSSHDMVLSPRATSKVEIGIIEAIRRQYIVERVCREVIDYQVLPPPIVELQVFIEEDTRRQGYAIVGRVGEVGYVYEVVGDPISFSHLWQSISFRYSQIYLNDRAGSPFYEWLRTTTEICWQPQAHTMWLPLSPDAKENITKGWHLSYFDRI